jgi:hypothetical protein
MSILDHGPVEEKYHDRMNELATALEMFFNPDGERKVCFTLLVTEFNTQGRLNYISNGRKEDIMTTMKELVGKYEPEIGRTLIVPK